jgi:glycosyltransferase involved in cell wall biosynthesis
MSTVFPPLSADLAVPAGIQPRVCIVSGEFVGVFKNGGIGTAYTSMAEALAGAGCAVTCLYVGDKPKAGTDITHWVESYRARRIEFIPLPSSGRPLLDHTPDFGKSFEVYEWLKGRPDFDVIHFPECNGYGYHTLSARRQGLLPGRTQVCVGIHSMTKWLRVAMQEHLCGLADLEHDFMERQSVALADVVVSPSQYLLNWIVDRGWSIPRRAYVQPNIMPQAAHPAKKPGPARQPVEELVFFGRLETRKGIELFCDAIDRIGPDLGRRIAWVTFLGRENTVKGLKPSEFIRQRAKQWPFKTQLLTNFDQREAVAYLQAPGRFAVIPSLMENSPNTVLECLGSGIAFIASRVGGIPELIDPKEVDSVCFEPKPEALAQTLRRAISEGARPSRIAFNPAANTQAWIDWHRRAAAESRREDAAGDEASPRAWPKVSVCVATFNRPNPLKQALESVEGIDYGNLEVLLVDDGGTDPAAVALLDELEPSFARRGWRVLRQKDRCLGAARNQAARHASGEYLLFMDDDDYAEPRELKTLVRAAERTKADIVACGMNVFEGSASPKRDEEPKRRVLPIGGLAALGAFTNCLGNANALVRRTCFEAAGGFTEDQSATNEDWAFHAKAVLKGFKLIVVPEFLFWHREDSSGRPRTTTRYLDTTGSIRPYIDAVPADLRDIIYLAQGWYERELKASISGQALSDYTKLTIRWRSKLEAGSALAVMNCREQAVRMMVEAVKSVQSSRNALVILQAMLAVGEALVPLDRKQATTLAKLASGFAKFSPDEDHRTAAARLLSRCLEGDDRPAAVTSGNSTAAPRLPAREGPVELASLADAL